MYIENIYIKYYIYIYKICFFSLENPDLHIIQAPDLHVGWAEAFVAIALKTSFCLRRPVSASMPW